MKILILLTTLLSAISSFACTMSESAYFSQRTIAAINTLNNVDEILKEVKVEADMTKITFTRKIVGSLFCVQREVEMNQDANCEFNVESKKDTFVKLNVCLDN